MLFYNNNHYLHNIVYMFALDIYIPNVKDGMHNALYMTYYMMALPITF